MAGGAQAQLRLPGVDLSRLPGVTGAVVQRLPATAPATIDALREQLPLQELRAATNRELLRRDRGELEADPAGQPVRRSQLLLWSPRAATLDAALAEGFVVLSDQTLDGLGLRRVVLRPPRGLGTAEALQRLQALDPELDVDFNHLLQRSGEVGGAAAAVAASVSTASVPTASGAAASGSAAAGPAAIPSPAQQRIGLIDSGIDMRHPALRRAAVHSWGCDGRVPPASAHGTAVASLLVGRDSAFVGSAPGATLYAADVYCGRDSGGAVDELIQALAWLARERVAVINVSLVGPANRVLERAVQALLARGHLMVAAVGNDGPAAPPLYPASYAGVIGVTGVNAALVALPEAARGPQVAFAAPGADLAAASAPARGYGAVRGTSFAAPLVAGLLAAELAVPDPVAAAAAVAALAARAVDLGAPGRDPVYGHGLVGAALRVAVERAPR